MIRSKKMVSCLIAAASVTLVAASGSQGVLHPDGSAISYRGWGPTTLSQDGYTCTLYDSNASRAGEIHFAFAGGRMDLRLGGRDAHFISDGSGLFSFHNLDQAAFPNLANVPAEFKTAGHSMMVFAARGQIGVNTQIATPVTSLARSITVVEARCVYIVDSSDVPVYCMNCIYEISTNDQ